MIPIFHFIQQENRRLRLVNKELLAALKEIEFHGGPAADCARAAIARAKDTMENDDHD